MSKNVMSGKKYCKNILTQHTLTLKVENKANTTVIMLWVALGVVVSVTLYFGIKEIIKARKLEIK